MAKLTGIEARIQFGPYQPYTGINEYQEFTRTTAVYPEAETGSIIELMYLGLGLTGEAGEISNKIKKLLRDGIDSVPYEELVGELGDVLWYAARLADALGEDLADIFAENQLKLERRKERGKLKGSGDKR